MVTVALIGPDGAGKTTIAREVVRRLGPAARYLYMGVNLDASTLMLPTTRLALAIKRRGGGRADLRAVNEGTPMTVPPGRRGRWLASLRSAVRTTNWIAEESFRHLVAGWQERRGAVVILDRLFLADYHAVDVANADPRRRIASRLHAFFLTRVFPVPDLVILLDAPAEVLHARKPETTVEYLERRRREYRDVANSVPRFEIVDVDRPADAVIADIVRLVQGARKPVRAQTRLP